MNIRRAAAGASIAALLPFAGSALAQTAPRPTQSTRNADRICGAKSKTRSSDCWSSSANSRSSRKPPRPPRQQRLRESRPARRASSSVRPTARTSSGCAARCTQTRAPTAANRCPKPPTPSSCGACGRPSKAPSAASTTSSSCRTSPAAASVIVDAYVAARFNPAAVVTVGKFKPPVGLERLQSSADIRFIERATTDQPRSESRPRRAALG